MPTWYIVGEVVLAIMIFWIVGSLLYHYLQEGGG